MRHYRDPRHIEIGARIRKARVKQGLRQVDLAAAAKLSIRHVIRMERGEGGEPKRETLDRIAEALGVKRSELADDADEEDDALARDLLTVLQRVAVKAGQA